MVVPDPQPIVQPLTTHAAFLVVEAVPGCDRAALEVVATVRDLVQAVGFRDTSALLSCVVGFGSAFWDRVRPADALRPAGLHPFEPLVGPAHAAPATPGDVLFHVRSTRADLVFEFVRQLMAALNGLVRVCDHTSGFRYFDTRDLLGFVDGTANPIGRAAETAALIGANEPEFAGGSYVIVQKYLHDLAAWQTLSVDEQETAVGRTKLEDIEHRDKAANAHTFLTDLDDVDGQPQEIVRANMPFGDPSIGEFGTYFIGYAADVAITERMLRNMFLGEASGMTDRLLDFSTAVTGGLFFVPANELLEALADEAPQAPDEHTMVAMPTAPERGTIDVSTADPGSIRIGDLRGQS